jgi:Flp pilus assembly protein TadB
MPDENQTTKLTVASQQQVTTVFHPRVLDMHSVTDQELIDIASGAQSIHIGFFGITFGALVAVALTLLTVSLASSMHAVFVAALIVLAVMSAYFGSRAVSDYRSSRSRVERIRQARRLDY